MEERWIQKEKKTWFKIIKKGIVLHCAALMIGGGLMIASPAMSADFTIDARTETTLQSLTEPFDTGIITETGVIAVTDQSAVRLDSTHGLSLTNDGTITAGSPFGNALAVSIGTVTNSTVLNSGDIEVTTSKYNTEATGVRFDGLDFYSSITNAGTLTVTSLGEDSDAYGIVGEDNDGNIDSNIMTVTAGGDDAVGISVFSNQEDGNISNSGAMTVTNTDYYGGNGDAVGIETYYNGGSISNSGTMTVTSDNAAVGIETEYNSGSISNSNTITVSGVYYAAGIFTNYNNDSIVNDGTLSVTSDIGRANGIVAADDNHSILNSDTLTVIAGEDAFGIKAGDNDYSIINSGSLTVTADLDAYGISVDGANSGIISNSGTMSMMVTAGGDATGIELRNNYYDATVSNSSALTVSAGEDATGISINRNDGSVVNDSTVEVSAVDGNAYGVSVEVNDGSISNNIDATISVTSVSGYAAGIRIGGDNDGDIANSGTLTATSTNNDARGISVGGYNSSDILNSGTMTVSSTNGIANGIYVGEDNTGSIENSLGLTVSAGEDAFGIYVDGTNRETISNSGTMTVTSTGGDATGIELDENYYTVTNSDTITVTADGSATGIDLSDNNEGATVGNSSTLAVTSAGAAYGVAVTDDNYGTILNSGSITATSTYSNATGISVSDNDGLIVNEDIIIASVLEAGEDGDAYGINAQYNSGTVANSGTITVGSVDGYAIGIGVYSNGEDGLVVNSGPLTVSSETNGAYGIYVEANYGSIENAAGSVLTVTGGESVVGIMSSNSYNGEITNSGTINVTKADGDYGEDGNFSAGILKGGLSYSSGGSRGYTSGVINNDGSITVVSGADALTIGVGAIGEDSGEGLNPSTINNTGLIRVEGGENGIGIGILNLNDYGYSDSVVNNSGTVEVVGTDGELHGEDYSVYTFGAVNNTETGSLTGNLLVGELNNDGMIRLPTAQGRVFGDFEQSAAGVLGITLFSDDNAEADYNIEYSQLRVDGDVVFADGTTVDVDVKTALDHQSLLINQTLEGVVVGEDAIGVDLEQLNVTDNSALLNFNALLSVEDSSLDLAVVKGVSIVEATLNNDEDDVVGAAEVLDDLLDDGTDDPEIEEFLDEVVGRETEAEVADDVLQASPVVAGALPGLNTQLFKTFNAIIHARQRSVRGFNSGDVAFSDNNLWTKAFGSYAEQEDDGATRGFVARSYGIGLGADGEYAPNKRAGVAFFYSNSDVDTNHVRQEADVDSFTLLGYGSNQIVDETVELFYQLGFGLQQMDTSRYVDALSGNADADYTAKSIYAELKGVKTLEMNDNFRTLLALALSYTYFDSPTYSEKGLGGMSLKVDSFDADSLTVEAEADFIYSLTANLELMANVGIGYDIIDDDVTIHSSFQGASNQTFVTDGVDSNPFVYQAGLGVAQNLRDDLSVDLNYDLEGRGSDFSSHTVSAKLNWKF